MRQNIAFMDRFMLVEMGYPKAEVERDLLNRMFPEIPAEITEKMVDFAYRHGINYFDTAWFYHDGKSEAFIGQALQKYPRDTVYLADKMPTPILTGLDQAKDIFQTQLDRCQVAYFDNYMLHSLTSQD